MGLTLLIVGGMASASQLQGQVTLARKALGSYLSPSVQKAVIAEALKFGLNIEDLRIEDLVKMKSDRFRDQYPKEYADLSRYLNKYNLRLGLSDLEVEFYRETGRSRLPEGMNPQNASSATEDVNKLSQDFDQARDSFLFSPVSGVSNTLGGRLEEIGIATFRDLLDVQKLKKIPALGLSEEQKFELQNLVRSVHRAMQKIVVQHAKLCSSILANIQSPKMIGQSLADEKEEGAPER